MYGILLLYMILCVYDIYMETFLALPPAAGPISMRVQQYCCGTQIRYICTSQSDDAVCTGNHPRVVFAQINESKVIVYLIISDHLIRSTSSGYDGMGLGRQKREEGSLQQQRRHSWRDGMGWEPCTAFMIDFSILFCRWDGSRETIITNQAFYSVMLPYMICTTMNYIVRIHA